ERYFEEGGPHASIDEVTMRDVAQLREHDYVAVVDVRFASEYEAGHVPGAINASYTRLPQYAEERLPEGKVLVVHCASGARSAAAAAWLQREGYDVKYVNGSFDSYREVGEVEEGPSSAEPALA